MWEPFQFRDCPLVVAGRIESEWIYRDSEPLTDAWWSPGGSLYCLRRRPGEAELLEIVDGRAETVARKLRVLQVGGRLEQGIVLNTESQLLLWSRNGIRELLRSTEGIAFFDTNASGAVACVVGRSPSQWRAVMLDREGGSPRRLNLKGVLAVLCLDDDHLLITRRKKVGEVERVSFSLCDQGGSCEELFSTESFLRGEIVSNGRGLVFVAGGLFRAQLHGGWLFDPRTPPPYQSIVSTLPLGYPAFLGSGCVVFGARLNAGEALVTASHERAEALLLDMEAPRNITASPDGHRVAWARPIQDGGILYVCSLPGT